MVTQFSQIMTLSRRINKVRKRERYECREIYILCPLKALNTPRWRNATTGDGEYDTTRMGNPAAIVVRATAPGDGINVAGPKMSLLIIRNCMICINIIFI